MRETIQNCVSIMEDKIDVKKEIDAMLAARKMEQNMMSFMPVGIILYMRLTSPGFYGCPVSQCGRGLYHDDLSWLLRSRIYLGQEDCGD